MKQFLYVVQDSLSKMVMPPFSSPNDEVAKRDFIIGSKNANIPIQDLHLWKIAEFNSGSLDDSFTFNLKPFEPAELVDPTLSEVAETVSSYNLGVEENE